MVSRQSPCFIFFYTNRASKTSPRAVRVVLLVGFCGSTRWGIFLTVATSNLGQPAPLCTVICSRIKGFIQHETIFLSRYFWCVCWQYAKPRNLEKFKDLQTGPHHTSRSFLFSKFSSVKLNSANSFLSLLRWDRWMFKNVWEIDSFRWKKMPPNLYGKKYH